MKKSLLIPLAALLLFASCDRKTASDLTFCRIVAERTTIDSVALELFKFSDAFKNISNPSEYVSYDIQFPSKAINETVLHRLQMAVLSTVFSNCDTAATDVDAELTRLLGEGMTVTKSDSCPVDPITMPDDSNIYYTSHHSVSVRTITNTKSLYTFSVSNDMYSFGAAHGLYTLTYHSYNSTTGNRLTFDSLFVAGADTIMQRYMQHQIPIDYRASYGEEFNFQGEPTVDSGTFYFTADGIFFSFPPYTIASYADGQIDCLIPTETIRPLLRPEWKKLYTK